MVVDLSLYEPFTRLVEITIEGKTFEVPENNIILRCVQYIVDEDVVPGRFCWNNECGNCEFGFRIAGETSVGRARGCQTLVREGMALLDFTPDLRYWLRDKLK